MKSEFSRHISEKNLSIKFHENLSSGSRDVPRGQMDGQTDVTRLIVTLRNFANAPRKNSHIFTSIHCTLHHNKVYLFNLVSNFTTRGIKNN